MSQLKKLIILVILILVIQLKKTDYKAKISEIENQKNDHDYAKYITTQVFNKLTADTFTARLKQTNLASKNDIANLVKKIDFNNKLLSF